MAFARPNARMHRLTGAQLLPSRQGHGIVAFARFCPSSGTPSSSVVQYCMVFIWLVTGVARLAGVRFHASRCYMSPIGRGTPSPAVFLISEAVRLSSSSFRCCPACDRVVPCFALQRVIVRRGTLQSGAFRLPVALVTRQIFGALLRSLGMGSALRCS